MIRIAAATTQRQYIKRSSQFIRTFSSSSPPAPPAPEKQGQRTTKAPPPILWTTHRLTQEQIIKVDALFHKILWLDMIETSILTDLINERLGVFMTTQQRNALRRQVEAACGDLDTTEGPEEVVQEEKGPSLVDIKLIGYDEKAKIKIIKEVRALAGLGLKEAKELVEGYPKVIQKDVKPEQAEEIKAKLEALGASVEIV